MNIKNTIMIPVTFLLLTACSATTRLESKQPNTQLTINKDAPISLDEGKPRSYKTTTFAKYAFKATKEGQDPMYGLVPLKFNGGYLVADILFFAPGIFFNLLEVFPYYQFDIDEGVIRYKKSEKSDWITYKPTEADIDNAKRFFQK